MITCRVEIYDMKKTPNEEGGYHPKVEDVLMEGRSPRGIMAQALKHCRDKDIQPCEIRILTTAPN